MLWHGYKKQNISHEFYTADLWKVYVNFYC